MTEFTEEDVQRYAAIGHRAWCGCTKSAGHLDDQRAARAVLGALVEDGRLRGPDEIVMSAAELDALPDEAPDLQALGERVARRREERRWQVFAGPPTRVGPWEPVDTPPAPPADEEKP